MGPLGNGRAAISGQPWTTLMKAPAKSFAVCIDNADQASLIPGKVYPLIRDSKAAKDDLLRIIDESGEDYLFHKSHFVFVDFRPL